MVMIMSDPGVDSIVVSGFVVLLVEFDKYWVRSKSKKWSGDETHWLVSSGGMWDDDNDETWEGEHELGDVEEAADAVASRVDQHNQNQDAVGYFH